MKNLRVYMLAAAGCLALTSCSEDDSSNNNNPDVSADLVGTYQLSSATAASAQDYDGDGDSSTNLALEGSCYNESWISFHDDGTYEEEINTTTMAEGGFALECESNVSAGTYTRDGNTINTTRTTGSGSVSATYNFNASSKTISRTENNATYTGFNSATSAWAELTGNLNLVFSKYTDNDDDNGQTINADDNVSSTGRAEILGGFNISKLLTSSSQDLDNDGQSSSNLVTELDCYTGSKINFKSDGTYEETSKTSVLGNLGLALDCNTTVKTGRWFRNGDDVYTRSSEGSVKTKFDLDTTANTVSRTEDNGSYPSFNSLTSIFTMLSGSLDYEYKKSNN